LMESDNAALGRGACLQSEAELRILSVAKTVCRHCLSLGKERRIGGQRIASFR
jgi:hypothetical protein